MTDAHEPNEIDGPHEGPIKTPKQLILAVVASFVIPIAAITLLVTYVTTASRPAAGSSDALGDAAVEQRLRPVGHVEVKDATDLASMKTGDQVFAGQCTACHTAGALGAPKFGDADAWAPRIKTGFDALLHSALAGKGSMPPQGGGDFSDLEIARAVVYMANKTGAGYPEPAASPNPSAATGAAAATTSTAATPMGGTAGVATGVDPNAARPAAANTAPLNTATVAPTAGPTNAGTQAVIVAAVTAGAAVPALYTQVCSVCHAAGIAGAPKFGDKAAWAPRVAQGVETLTAHAIKGQGAMPPRGGSTASDADIKAVVAYMVGAAK